MLGSQAYATKARQEKMQIEAVLNNDIIGNEVAGNGRSANNHVRLFSEGPEDSPSRSLARYTKEIAERYLPSMTVDHGFRRDRFGRGGDHTSFNREGFAAVLASLALAPKPPVVSRPRAAGRTAGIGTRPQSGPGLSRGKSGYDAALRWEMTNPEPDLAGYAVVIRETTSPLWEREIYVGNVSEYTMPDLSIDDIVIGVKAIDKDGNQSLVSTYDLPAAAPANRSTTGGQ